MGPIDYAIDVQTPFQAALQGYQGGAAIRNDQQQQALLAQQQAAAQQQQQLLSRLASNPNATANDYAAVMTQIPSMSEHLARAWSTKNSAQQQAQASDLLQWGSAIKSGRPDIAAEMLNKRADAIEKGGAPTPESQALRVHAQTIEAHPEFALGQIQAMLSANPNGKDAASSLAALGTEQRAQAEAPATLAAKEAEAKIKGAEATTALEKNVWDIANVKSQVNERAARLGLDRDKLTTDTQLKLTELQQKFGELPESVAKEVNSAAVNAIAAEQTASKATELADRFEKLGGGWGGAATAAEAWAKLSGTQDALSRARGDYERLRNSEAVRNLPPGSASDSDVKMALAGFPPDTADSRQIAQFLRGTAKLNQLTGIMENAKSEWFGAVRSLGKAKNDIEIDGVKVPKDTTFKNFVDGYLKRKTAERTSAETIAKSPYAQFAKPIAPPMATTGSPAANPMQQVLPVTGGM